MIKLVGYLQSKGNFTNKETGQLVDYDNTELFCLTDEKEGVKGLFPITAKAKTEELKIIGKANNLDDALQKEVYLITDLTAKKDENGKQRLNVAKIMVV